MVKFIDFKQQFRVKHTFKMPIFMTLTLFLVAPKTSIKAQAENAPPQYSASKKSNITENALEKTDFLPIYTLVEEQPEFVGGQKAYSKFLRETVQYPKDAIENDIQGTLYIGFVVEIDGSISNITCKRAPQVVDSIKTYKEDGTVLDVIVFKKDAVSLVEEAKRVIAAMPRWIAGRHKGVPVRTAYTLPIKFRLSCG